MDVSLWETVQNVILYDLSKSTCTALIDVGRKDGAVKGSFE